jgi:hypothetical protein
MPVQSCAPPESLVLWTAALLAGMGLLVVVALALESARWRPSRGALALRLAGALLSVALAGWSLLLRSQLRAIYDALAAREQFDPHYCYGGLHGPPGAHDAIERLIAAQIAPYQRAALITTSATVAFVLAVVALAALRWLRNRRPMRVRPRWRAERARALSLILLLALILASLGDFAVIQVQSVRAQIALDAPCPSSMTSADVQHLRDEGIALIPSQDTVTISAQQARTTSREGLGDLLPANAVCIVPQLYFVDHSTQYIAPRFAILWVVGWRIPAATAGPGTLATPPSEEWTFVDAQSGEYLGNTFISVVGG